MGCSGTKIKITRQGTEEVIFTTFQLKRGLAPLFHSNNRLGLEGGLEDPFLLPEPRMRASLSKIISIS